jgi:hypothetical protein
MSGIASIILAAIGSFLPGLPGWSFWLAAMICLFIAMFRAWQQEHRHAQVASAAWAKERGELIARLAGDAITGQRKAQVKQIVEGLGQPEREALRHILRLGPTSAFGLGKHLRHKGLADADLTRLADIGVIWQDAAGAWDVAPAFNGPLRALLSDG